MGWPATLPLRTHLALLTFLAVAVPVALTGGFTFHHLAGTAVDDIERHNLALAGSVAGEVEAFLRSPRYVLANIRELVLHPHQTGAAHGPDLVLDTYLVEDSPGLSSGEELFESIYMLDATGRVVSVGLPSAAKRQHSSILGLDLSHKPFFQAAAGAGGPSWSSTFLSLISGRMSLALAMPVDTDMVLVGNLNLGLLQQVVGKIRQSGPLEVALIDRDGTVVAHTNPEVAARKVNLSHVPPVREALAGRQGTLEYPGDGAKLLGSAAPIPGPGWVALVSQPTTAAFAPIRHTATIAATVGAVALGFAVWLALVVAKRYSEPLVLLTEQARGAAAGEFEFPGVGGRFQEVEQLGHTFSEMLSVLGTRERQLTESGRRYRELAELLPQVVFETDLEGNITYANQRGFTLFGVTQEDLDAGLSIIQLLSPKDHKRALDNMRLRLHGEEAPSNEYDMVTSDNSSLSVLIYTNPILQDGRPVGLRGVLVDITRRRVMEDALRFTQFAMDHLSDAVFFLHPDGGVAYANEAAGTTLGYTREELLGLRVFAIDPEFSPDQWREHWQQVRAAGTLNLTTRHRSRDGTIREVEVSANHVVFGGEEFICAVARDLTERRSLEEQFRQSQKMEAVGTLASGIAHDFNNLLQAISGYTELLLVSTDDQRTRGRLEQVAGAAASAAELVQQILAFSRRRRLDRRPIDLNREVHHATEMLRRTLPKMIRIEERLDPELWHLNADPTQVEQVVMNLSTNARDAMPNGGRLTMATRNRTLDIGEHPQLAPGQYVELTVTDEGTGMNRETQERIFEPFFTTKGVGEGTGLGLASAYGIITAHGGHLHCDSTPGSGTRFTITLPALPEVAPTPRPGTQDEAAAPSGGERVLVVDDEKMVRGLARDGLETFGYQVATANDGEQALEVYRQALNGSTDGFHAVILDLGMPGMGGRQCLEELLRLDPNAQVLVASGYGDPALRNEVLSAGAAAFVGKPYRLQELCETLRAVLDGAPPPSSEL